MAMTAREILAATFPDVKAAARGVVIQGTTWEPTFIGPTSKLVQRLPKAAGAPILKVKAHSVSVGPDGKPKKGAPAVYAVTVHGTDVDQHLHSGNIMVYCQCDYFTFTSEVALAKRGATRVLQSNGDSPDVRNPRMIPTPCKHAYAVLSQIVRKRIG
jgi:hypothetical protein